jgi:hypothetical protein
MSRRAVTLVVLSSSLCRLTASGWARQLLGPTRIQPVRLTPLRNQELGGHRVRRS